jgi:hypothetical protein
MDALGIRGVQDGAQAECALRGVIEAAGGYADAGAHVNSLTTEGEKGRRGEGGKGRTIISPHPPILKSFLMILCVSVPLWFKNRMDR